MHDRHQPRGRGFGSSVGQELATRLGWRLYDQELLDQLAAEMGLQPSLLNGVDERPMSWVRDLLESFSTQPAPPPPATPTA